MGSRVFFCFWVVAVCALAGACGKSEGEAVPRDQFASRAAGIFCESRRGCCQASSLSFDLAGCKAEARAGFEAEWSEFGARVRYDDGAAGDCLGELSDALVCGSLRGNSGLPACQGVFVGTVTLGGVCRSSVECKPSGSSRPRCVFDDSGVADTGVCTQESVGGAAPHGKVGDVCNSTCSDDEGSEGSCPVVVGPGEAPAEPASTCYKSDGVYCSFDLTNECQPLAEIGAPCSDYDQCRAKSFCDFDTGLCSAPQANGAACTSRDECQSGFCDIADDAGSGICSDVYVTADDCSNPDFD